MAIYPLRKLPALPCSGIETQWLEKLAAELKSGTDRAVLCRRTLCEIAYPQFVSSWETAVEDTKLPLATRLALSALLAGVTLWIRVVEVIPDGRRRR